MITCGPQIMKLELQEAKRKQRRFQHPLFRPIPVSYTHLDVYKRQSQNGGAQLCVLCKVLLIVHGMAETQPSIAGNGQSGQGFQQADGPVPPLILQILT